jgi:protease I
MKQKRVVILTGPGFEDAEVIYPFYRLNEAGFKIEVVTSSDSEVTGKHGVPITPTLKISDLATCDFDAVIVPGGLEAPDRLRQIKAVVEFVKKMFRSGKLVSSICHGPWVLASADILKSKKATCYPGMKDDLIHAGAEYTSEAVTVDGNLITSDHPRHLSDWMRETVNYLNK